MMKQKTGLLLSGGLDSAVLLAHLAERGHFVQPFYIRAQLTWEAAELSAVRQFLEKLASPAVAPLVVLDLPVRDMYGEHWSLTGTGVPDEETPDEAVYLPGRNLLLVMKAALWCQLHGIRRLALAVLSSNPFPDATPEFFANLQSTLQLGVGEPLEILRPFSGLKKADVIQLGHAAPLELTFSCIDPVDGLHCGACNKCAERKGAFAAVGLPDHTRYAKRLAVP